MKKTNKFASIFFIFFIALIAIGFIFQILYLGVIKIISMIPEYLILFLIMTFVSYIIFKNKYKTHKLMKNYKDPKIVDMILQKIIWFGESYEQVVDSFGRPEEIQFKQSKKKKKEILKYNYDDKRRRYNLRIILEDNLVIGWEGIR